MNTEIREALDSTSDDELTALLDAFVLLCAHPFGLDLMRKTSILPETKRPLPVVPGAEVSRVDDRDLSWVAASREERR